MDTVIEVLQYLMYAAGSLFAFCFVLRLLGYHQDLLAAIAGNVFWFVAASYVIVVYGWPLAVPLFLFVCLAVGWIAFTYHGYCQARRNELLHVLSTAVDAQLPLAPAVRAYLRDRSYQGESSWDVLLLYLLPQGYLLWRQRHGFDRRTARLADLLGQGASLSQALRAARGVAPREVRVAAAVGGTIGRLADCLRRAQRDRLSSAWTEAAPRLVYPLLMLLFIGGITGFMMIQAMPRLQRIFADYGEPMPRLTQWFTTVWDNIDAHQDLIVPIILAVGAVGALLVVSPTLRWYVPVIGRFSRWEAQGLVLRMLGALTEVGRPAPESLQLLANTEDFSAVVRQRLDTARDTVRRGESLAPALRGAGLLPGSMVSLVQIAERTQTLSWTLTELGDFLAGRAVRLARRLSLLLSPILVIAVGLLVGLIAVGMFMPLIQVLTRLST